MEWVERPGYYPRGQEDKWPGLEGGDGIGEQWGVGWRNGEWTALGDWLGGNDWKCAGAQKELRVERDSDESSGFGPLWGAKLRASGRRMGERWAGV